MSLSIRPAEPQDTDTLLQLIEEFYRHEEIVFDPAVSRGAVRQMLEDPKLGAIWLLVADGQVAGYMAAIFGFILEFGGRQLFLDELFVRSAWQGRGFGAAVLQFLEEEARRQDIRVLRLEVARTNSRALALYQKHGFELHDRNTMTKRL